VSGPFSKIGILDVVRRQWNRVLRRADIEELNRILEQAVNLKNFLKGRERLREVARHVAEHYRANVEPLGYKAFLVAVDREACVFYKEALDTILPPQYSEIVFTAQNSMPNNSQSDNGVEDHRNATALGRLSFAKRR